MKKLAEDDWAFLFTNMRQSILKKAKTIFGYLDVCNRYGQLVHSFSIASHYLCHIDDLYFVPIVNSMASQIQGLKKVAAANRNKTKSQMRDSNNPTQNLNNSVQVQSSNQNNIISSQNIVSSLIAINIWYIICPCL